MMLQKINRWRTGSNSIQKAQNFQLFLSMETWLVDLKKLDSTYKQISLIKISYRNARFPPHKNNITNSSVKVKRSFLLMDSLLKINNHRKKLKKGKRNMEKILQFTI